MIEAANTSAQPNILLDQPLDVRLYTPRLLRVYRSVRAMLTNLNRLAGQFIVFTGEFHSLGDDDFARAELAPLMVIPSERPDAEAAALRTALFGALDACRTAALTLCEDTAETQRIFWLANHTRAANWDTVEQLDYRAAQDAVAADIDPNHVPLATWEDQVKAAIIGCNRDKEGLTSDGKALKGPVLPRLALKQQTNAPKGGGGGGRGHGGGKGHPPAAHTAGGKGGSRIAGRLGAKKGGHGGKGKPPAGGAARSNENARPAPAAAQAAAGAGAAGGP
jgi:hypothetical protein